MMIDQYIFSIILALLMALAGILAWKATHSTDSKFDLSTAFLDAEGKTSMSRIAQFAALTVSTWAFAYLTVGGKLTEWFMTAYLAAWVANGIGSKWLDKKD